MATSPTKVSVTDTKYSRVRIVGGLPHYSSHSLDDAAPPPAYSAQLTSGLSDPEERLSQIEALVLLEREARMHELEERRRRLWEQDKRLAATLKMVGF